MKKNKSGKTVSLVLGSGGARGMAHIGVIKELESAGYEIKAVSGSSIGALVGGVYAAGKLDEFTEWAMAIRRLTVLKLMDVNWGAGGLLRGERIFEVITPLIGNWNIEDLPLKFTATATDITKEKEVWINSGPLFSAIRESLSLPMFMTPVYRDKMMLVDGGVLNPLPMGPTLSDNTDMTIAVNLSGVPLMHSPEEVEVKSSKKVDSISDRILQFVENFTDKKSNQSSDTDKNSSMFEVMDRTFDVMQNSISRLKLAANPPDHLIELPRNACSTMDFHLTSQMIELGREKAKTLIEEIE